MCHAMKSSSLKYGIFVLRIMHVLNDSYKDNGKILQNMFVIYSKEPNTQ